jgi:hypothetical protein
MRNFWRYRKDFIFWLVEILASIWLGSALVVVAQGTWLTFPIAVTAFVCTIIGMFGLIGASI